MTATMASTEITLRVAGALTEIERTAWDACANPQADLGGDVQPNAQECAGAPLAAEASSRTEYNPFISHDFLSALERSGSVRSRTGWQPMHLIAQAAGGEILGVAPCYAKSHSQGEYVFDHGWAEAYERAGGSYYPKLQVSVPFTPATGRRLLVRSGPLAQTVRGALAGGLAEICRRSNASSVHVTFPTDPNGSCLESTTICCAPIANSIGRMPATNPSTTFWLRWRRASARPSGASAPMRWLTASASIGFPDRT